MNPVLVLRSNDICFVGILRSCAAAGIPTEAVIFDWPGAGPWHSEQSRHFGPHHRISNPFEFPQQAAAEFRSLLEDFRRRYGEPPTVIPSSDTNLMFLLDNAEAFDGGFRLIGHRRGAPYPHDVIDKARCFELLGDGGVSIPLSASCARAAEIETVCEAMRYPCVYKPATKDYGQSFYRKHAGLKAVECADRSSLRAALADELADGFKLIVQEKVRFEGPEQEIPFYLYADTEGVIRTASTAIKRHIQPFPFGTATVLELSWHEELVAHAQAVVDALQWHGILMIEFIRDQADGVWKVIELNPRPWLFVDFFRRSGVNFLATLATELAGEPLGDAACCRPEAELLARRPLHLDLTALLCRDAADGGFADFDALRACHDGAWSSTFLDPDDEQPGLSEARQVAKRRGAEAEALIAEWRSVLS